jgi:hypothetical protein
MQTRLRSFIGYLEYAGFEVVRGVEHMF